MTNSILDEITALQRELAALNNRFEEAVDPVLVDSIIYEIRAVHTEYGRLLELCKQQGIECEEKP